MTIHGSPLPPRPYKGLQYYGNEDVPLFAGRHREILECTRLIAASRSRITVLHGTTGSGKSSFLRAGIIPFLEHQAHAFEFLRPGRDLSAEVMFVHSTGSPLAALARTVHELAHQEFSLATPLGTKHLCLKSALLDHVERESFLADVGRTPERMRECLTRIASRLPWTLVLVIDQAEEVFTVRSAGTHASSEAYFRLLALLSRTNCDLKLILSIRTEYFGRLHDELRRQGADMSAVSAYMLVELDQAGIVEAIKRPAEHEQYGFRLEVDLPERIAVDVTEKAPAGGALPAMQIICAELYARTKAREPRPAVIEIVHGDYTGLGPISEQIGQYVDLALFKAIAAGSGAGWAQWLSEVLAWQGVMDDFCHVQADGSVATKHLTLSEVRQRAQRHGCRAPVETIVNFLIRDDQRILRRIEGVQDIDALYSLGHDVLGSVLHARRSALGPTATALLKWSHALERRLPKGETFIVGLLRLMVWTGHASELRDDRLMREWLRRNPKTARIVEPEADILRAVASSDPDQPYHGPRASAWSRVLRVLGWSTWMIPILILLGPVMFILTLPASHGSKCDGAIQCFKMWASCAGTWTSEWDERGVRGKCISPPVEPGSEAGSR